MKFQLAVNLERMDDSADMQEVARHTIDMVQRAEPVSYTHLTLPTILRV